MAMLTRESIDIRGQIGSIYDACQDCFVGQLNLNNKSKIRQSKKFIRCQIKRLINQEKENLLEFIDIDEQLKLSLLLKLIPRKGISSIVNCPYSTTKDTRLFFYRYINSIEIFNEKSFKDNEEFVQMLLNAENGTHWINRIEYGIDLIIILQFPSDKDQCRNLDQLFKKLLICLYSNYHISSILLEEKDLIDQIVHTQIYSNIPHLSNLKNLYDLFEYIDQNKYTLTDCPIKYKLQSIHMTKRYIPLSQQFNSQITNYLFKLISDINSLERFLNENLNQFLNKDDKQLLIRIENLWINIQNDYTHLINYLSKIIFNIRCGNIEHFHINQIYNNEKNVLLKENLKKLNDIFDYLNDRKNLINLLNQFDIEYKHIQYLNLNGQNNLTSIEKKLFNDHKLFNRIICSNSYLNQNFKETFLNLLNSLIEQRQQNPNLRILYLDFSYSQLKLTDIILLPLNLFNQEKFFSKSKQTIDGDEDEDDRMNIVFIGEKSVGKSTLINSFVNYLKYQSLDKAQSGKVLSIIPISFLITFGDYFQKQTIQSKSVFNSINQKICDKEMKEECQSYLFRLNESKYRLIDTPALTSDEQINEDIIEYLYQFDHLNAICFVFKSNQYYIDQSYSKFIQQLILRFGEEIQKLFLFSFTHGRSTFYSSSYITKLISEKLNNINLEENESFVFDNESFSYLIGLENGIKYIDHEIEDFNTSWSISSNELDYFLHYITNKQLKYLINKTLPTIFNLKYQINLLIDPILETIENLLQNLILWNMDSPYKSIQFNIKIPDQFSLICHSCNKKDPISIGNFLMENVNYHRIKDNKCLNCPCLINEHSQRNYLLEYKYLNQSSIYSRNQMKSILENLSLISSQISKFLCETIDSSKDDPFLIGLTNLIKQEEYLINNFNQNSFNIQLMNDLNQFINKYQTNQKNIKINFNLEQIFHLINQLKQYPTIQIQFNAAKKGININRKQYEYDIEPFLNIQHI